ncbi:MAG: hypothetical protein QXU40_01750, partial [Candidatus Pacearchaeota archaeon]
MLIKLESPIILSKVIDIISELVSEVRIKVNDFGLSITAMDPANVSMVKFILKKEFFSVFETEDEVLGINLDNLRRILKRASSASSVIMEKSGNLLNIKIQDRIKRNFNLSLIDIEKSEKEMPSLEFDSVVEINSQDLADCIDDCLVVSDSCSFFV